MRIIEVPPRSSDFLLQSSAQIARHGNPCNGIYPELPQVKKRRATFKFVLVFLLLILLALSIHSSLQGPAWGTVQFNPTSKVAILDQGKGRLLRSEPEPKDVPILTIYQQYHANDSWPHLAPKGDLIFRGLNQKAGQLRDGFDDVDATALLPLLKDQYYQDLLCEYSGFFALANHLDKVHKPKWLGFQSWRAPLKGFALTELAQSQLMGALRDEAHGPNVIYFWSLGDSLSPEMNLDFYQSCNYHHMEQCSPVFAKLVHRLFDHKRGEGTAPPMPTTNNWWIYMSYWVMTRELFQTYMEFARMAFVVLDGLFYEEHHDQHKCLLSKPGLEYVATHCWCYIMERLINIWAYHRGITMIYVHHHTGQMTEQHLLPLRDRWFDVFGPSAQDALLKRFPLLAKQFPHGEELYRSLQGI